MDDIYWKQFMITGKIEDYLQFKGIVKEQENAQKIEKERKNEVLRENPTEREKWM